MQALLLAQDRCAAKMMQHSAYTLGLLDHLDRLAVPQLRMAFQVFSKMMLLEGVTAEEDLDADANDTPVSTALQVRTPATSHQCGIYIEGRAHGHNVD
jgi:hypothetical protein